uniref:DNA-directed RNA polymerase III subunit RPC3 n=1 Tax=Chenopodium quinoa TaxID=63459 RepID=A0A803M0C2_CHEQI
MAALTPFGIKLAVHIITTDFGNLVSKICECLLRRGTLSKALISRFTELPQDKVKKCLWVLIQHNCVQAFALEQEGGGKDTTVVVTQYMALFNNIIHRLRFPKFMSIVSKEQDTKVRSSDTHQESFTKLVRCRFVERCPAPEPLISLPNEGDTPAKKGGGRNKVFMKEVTLEERALAAAIPMDAERFSISYDQGVDSDEEKIESKISGLKVGEKRKQDSLDWDSELDTMGGKKEPACVEHVRAEYDNVAAVILKSMLEGAKHTVSSVSLSLDSIFEEVIKSKEGLTMEHLRYSLEQLDFCSETNDVYTINMKDIIKKAQLEEVECIVKKRYGIEAFRIFRSLTNGRPLDTDKISERTFVDKKNTPQTLYKLWKDNYILMEKVTTGGPRQADFFLWSVKKGNLWHQILDELYHAALNLCLRYAYEVDQEREIQNLSIENPSPEVKERRMRLRNVRILLDSSLMKLDDAVMIFHDFLL